MLVEMAWSWSPDDRRVDRIGEIHGFENLEAAEKRGKGVLVVTSHNTCLEIGARVATRRMWASGMYRPLRNEVLEWYQNRGRGRYTYSMVSKRNMRTGIRLLREGRNLWYAPDQDFGPEQSVFAPFFGITAATLLATHRLPRMTGCAVVMMFPWYDRGTRRYHVEYLPALEDYPTDDPVADLTRVNAIIENSILRHAPEQYWWIHRRFKTRPEGDPPFYD
jgi:KDO2-lipid IV(A) lauroyltransferase